MALEDLVRDDYQGQKGSVDRTDELPDGRPYPHAVAPLASYYFVTPRPAPDPNLLLKRYLLLNLSPEQT
jgi:hypothetical protein